MVTGCSVSLLMVARFRYSGKILARRGDSLYKCVGYNEKHGCVVYLFIVEYVKSKYGVMLKKLVLHFLVYK